MWLESLQTQHQRALATRTFITGQLSYFHYFTAKESKLASERVIEIWFAQRVLAQLNDIPFMLPQHPSHETDSHFCNETVYGKLILLMVIGVVIMKMVWSTHCYAKKRGVHVPSATC